MKPWFEIATPQSMIRSGHINESMYIADLLDITQGKALSAYQSPRLFFKQTYLTRGLCNLLSGVQKKLCEGQGSSIIKLQTAFGGGKTHALIVIYHYIKHGDQLTADLPDISQLNVKLVTIGGTHLNPIEGQEKRDVHVHTIWGDMAFQLGGLKGYNEFKTNDINRISPGKEKLKEFLSKHEPLLILIDEIVEYVNKALGVSIYESNLGTQTLLFIQELTEALASLSRGLLIITLPIHQYEDYSEVTRKTLDQVNHILGRLETTETPIEREEIYPLVIKRLIEKVISKEERDKVIFEYIQIYRNKHNELPEKVKIQKYSKRMKDSYPFHPRLIDVLYDNWCTIPEFQGTRAILRILSRVLAQLWSSKKQIDLIFPSDIDFHNTALKNEFLQHLSSQYTQIFTEEMLGPQSRAGILDQKNPEWNNLASKVSKSIFLSSFAKNKDLKGINLSKLKLSLIRPSFQASLIPEIVHYVKKNLWYIHLQNGLYFFSHMPNLNQEIENMKDLFNDSFEIHLRKEIKNHLGKEIQTILWPNSSKEITDDQHIKIVFIHHSTELYTIKEWLNKRGKTFRLNKNTIIYALPNKTHLVSLKDVILTKLALIELKKKMTKKSRIETHIYEQEILDRLKRCKESLSYNIRRFYSIFYDGTRKISLGLPTTDYESLTEWYKRELFDQEFIVSKLHYKKLIELLFGPKPFYHTKTILEQFYINPNLLKIETAQVIQESICRGVEKGAFGICTLTHDKIQTKNFIFSRIISPDHITFSSSEVLIKAEIARAIIDKLKEDPTINEIMVTETMDSKSGSPLKSAFDTFTTPRETYSLQLEVRGLKSTLLPDFYRGVLFPLEKNNTEILLEIKISLKAEQEVPESIINTKIKETITQLGAKITTIETER